MIYYLIKKKYSLPFIVLLALCIQSNAAIQKERMDPATIEWCKRIDVKDAVKKLNDAHLALEDYVQRIYNAYAPYTIGEEGPMRTRMKDVARLITAAGNVEGIFCNYRGFAETTTPRKNVIPQLKEAIRFYYFDQELRTLNIERNIIRELLSTLEALCNTEWHPDFIKATKFDRQEAIRIIKQVEAAIHAAVATIPDGSTILQFNNC
jgi:hypothetical protein